MNIFRKYLVIGIIFLFVGASVLPTIGTKELNSMFSEIETTEVKSEKGKIGGSDLCCDCDIWVDNDSECPGNGTLEWPYCKIQYAIENASSGDCICVMNGTYYENVFINKSINLIGENRDTTVIDGGNNGVVVYIYYTNQVNISSFTVTNGHTGIKMRQSNYCNISMNYINDNILAGMHIISGDDNVIFSNNRITGSEYGFGIDNGNNNLIIYNNIYSDTCGIYLDNCSNNELICNEIFSNNWGIYLETCNHNKLFGNTIENNAIGVFLWYSRLNYIIKNNFKANIDHASFLNSFFNLWCCNYWDDWPGIIPRPIFGTRIGIIIPTPWITFDIFPHWIEWDICDNPSI